MLEFNYKYSCSRITVYILRLTARLDQDSLIAIDLQCQNRNLRITNLEHLSSHDA